MNKIICALAITVAAAVGIEFGTSTLAKEVANSPSLTMVGGCLKNANGTAKCEPASNGGGQNQSPSNAPPAAQEQPQTLSTQGRATDGKSAAPAQSQTPPSDSQPQPK